MNKFWIRCAVVFLVVLGAAGCANNVNTGAKKAAKANVVKTQQLKRRQALVVNQARKVNKAGKRVGKDKHHIEFERKRMAYNQQWLAKQQTESRQQAQRLKYQQEYERNKRLQEQERVRLQQQRQQQLALAQRSTQQQQVVNVVQNQQRSQYSNKQAQIEAQQQRHNWRKDGGWRYANQAQRAKARKVKPRPRAQPRYVSRARTNNHVNMAEQLSNAAIARTYQKVRYDGRYIAISYPMGDVPANMGVCTDTLIRSYRRLGIDLQRLVHEDISRDFYAYPNLPKWGLSAPDPNIDHRRVHNLKVFFARHGQRLPVTNNPADYRPGDIVTWHLGGDQEHIGLVVNRRSPVDPRRYMIVHNIAKGDRMEDMLFRLPITAHYRYLPRRSSRWLASR